VLEGSGTYPGTDTTFIEVAWWVNFGTSRMPAREFIGYPIRVKRIEYSNLISRLVRAMLTGRMSHTIAAGVLGQKIVGDVKQRITDVGAIDTGKLRSHITYVEV
jgi:hypothetical protein